MMQESIIDLLNQKISFFQNTNNTDKFRPIIFIHGNSSNKSVYKHILKMPEIEKYPFYVLDLPGHGDSSWDAEGRYDISFFSEVIKEFVLALKLENPVLVGHSLGGHIVIKLASMIKTSGLVIFQASPVDYLKELVVAYNQIPDSACMYMEKPLDEDFQKFLDLITNDITIQNQILIPYTKADPKVRSHLAMSLSDPGKYLGELNNLKNYERPLLIIHGASDPMINFSYLMNLGYQIELIKDEGHYPTLTSPEEFTGILSRFIENKIKHEN
jgi:pimeloyl-ACP methyl ester carboxylesterase